MDDLKAQIRAILEDLEAEASYESINLTARLPADEIARAVQQLTDILQNHAREYFGVYNETPTKGPNNAQAPDFCHACQAAQDS